LNSGFCRRNVLSIQRRYDEGKLTRSGRSRSRSMWQWLFVTIFVHAVHIPRVLVRYRFPDPIRFVHQWPRLFCFYRRRCPRWNILIHLSLQHSPTREPLGPEIKRREPPLLLRPISRNGLDPRRSPRPDVCHWCLSMLSGDSSVPLISFQSFFRDRQSARFRR